jgi:CheY-like chemotaxis protein/anti-sigma regulatory factor (Ser/Thr protein kinase)
VIDASKHHLTVHLPAPQTVFVDADLTRLCQVIANLLNNAAKYTPPSGSIEITAESDGNYAVISVQDSGIGIHREMLPRIFEMFAQVDRSKGRSQGGLGIGLALVKRLVEMHGGSVQASSDGLACGSKFVVRIPALSTMPLAPESPPLQALQCESNSGFRVLVVDDNLDNAASLAQVLEILGYETHVENDGLSAVAAAQSFLPRAVFLDIGLPKLNGREVARRIRKQEAGREMLLVALSGWGQDDDRRKSKEAGFDYHFVKPVALDTLTELLKNIGDNVRVTVSPA